MHVKIKRCRTFIKVQRISASFLDPRCVSTAARSRIFAKREVIAEIFALTQVYAMQPTDFAYDGIKIIHNNL